MKKSAIIEMLEKRIVDLEATMNGYSKEAIIEILEKRTAELEATMNDYSKKANLQVAAYQGGIAENRRLLKLLKEQNETKAEA
jgi:uncharacterized coiled-coil protein SlyX